MIDAILILMALAMVVEAAMVILLTRQVEQQRANMLTIQRNMLELHRRLNQYYEELAR